MVSLLFSLYQRDRYAKEYSRREIEKTYVWRTIISTWNKIKLTDRFFRYEFILQKLSLRQKHHYSMKSEPWAVNRLLRKIIVTQHFFFLQFSFIWFFILFFLSFFSFCQKSVNHIAFILRLRFSAFLVSFESYSIFEFIIGNEGIIIIWIINYMIFLNIQFRQLSISDKAFFLISYFSWLQKAVNYEWIPRCKRSI